MRKFTHLFKTTIFCCSTLKKPGAMEPLLMLKDPPGIDPLENNLITNVYKRDLDG